MVDYVTSETACRSRMLLRYFGEKNENNCGQCDVCLSGHAAHELPTDTFEKLKKELLTILQEQVLTPAEVAEKTEADRDLLSHAIQYLLEEGEIKIKDGILSIG